MERASQELAGTATPANLEPRGRVRRAAWAYLAGVLYTIATILAGFVATPILLRLLGGERLGSFRVMGEWLGYLTVVDVGLTSALPVFLLRAYSGTDPHAPRALTRYGLRLMSAVAAIVMLPLGLLFTWFCPRLIPVSASMVGELRLAALITLGSILLYPIGIFRANLEVTQRGYVVTLGLLAQSLVTTGLGLGLAYLGFRLPGQALASVLGLVVASLIWAWSVRRAMPPGVAASPLPTRSALWRTSWPFALSGMGNRLNVMTDSMVVAAFLGPIAVTTLFLTQRVISLAGGQVNGLAVVSWPALLELRARGERDAFERRLSELTTLLITLGITLTGTVAAYNKHFMNLWVGAAYDGGPLLALFTALGSIIFGFVCLFAWVIDMQGDTRHRLRVSTVGSVLNLLFSVLAVRAIGVPGVALGTLAAYLCTDAWYCPTLVCRRYDVRPRVIVVAIVRAVAFGVPWVTGVWILASVHVPPFRWVGLLAEEGALACAGLTYCWLAVFTPEDRRLWKARFAGLLRRAA
ncbi:MAG TPA: lipopolysaccharide biosynthesis protein [Polyangiaceae bacterium]|nr:lipopolysaccharide biosynthesis protein [Polyangiaceae bacterium]